MCSHDVGNAAGLVPDARYQRRHIVNAADQNAADQNPNQRRNPTEQQPRDDRADDRPRRRDRREVLREQIGRRRRHEVFAVIDLAGRGGGIAVQFELAD